MPDDEAGEGCMPDDEPGMQGLTRKPEHHQHYGRTEQQHKGVLGSRVSDPERQKGSQPKRSHTMKDKSKVIRTTAPKDPLRRARAKS